MNLQNRGQTRAYMIMYMYMKMIMIMSMIMRVGERKIIARPARVRHRGEDSFPFPSFSFLRFIFSESIVFQSLPRDT